MPNMHDRYQEAPETEEKVGSVGNALARRDRPSPRKPSTIRIASDDEGIPQTSSV